MKILQRKINKARYKRPPVKMRDYSIGEDFCEDVDEAVWMRDYAIGEVFFVKKMMKLSHVYPY